MTPDRECNKCHQVKPMDAFAINPDNKGGHDYRCKACKAAERREARAEQTPEERNRAMAAYRAGIRKDTCAVCAGPTPAPLCEACTTAIRALGGTEAALKRAAKAVKYLGGV